MQDSTERLFVDPEISEGIAFTTTTDKNMEV